MLKYYILALLFGILLGFSMNSFGNCRPVTIITPEGETILVTVCDA